MVQDLIYLKEWETLIKSGNVGNFGRKTDDTKMLFQQEEVL